MTVPQGIRRSMLAITTALVLLALAVTVVAVLQAAKNNIRERASTDLAMAGRVFDRMLLDRREQLSGHASLLAQDMRFRQAIAKHAITRNDSDVVQLLLAHQQSIAADLSVLVDGRGRVISPRPQEDFSASVFRRLPASELNRTSAVAVINERPYQLVFAPVKAANWVAWVGMGFRIDAELMDTLKAVTQIQATVLYQDSTGGVQQVTTLPDSLAGLLEPRNQLQPTVADFRQALEENNWQSLSYPLLQSTEDELLLLLSTSIADDLAAYQALRSQLLVVLLLIALLAAAVAFWFSGRANHAVRSLALAAHRIAHGDYSKNLAFADSRRLGPLENAFNAMQRAIEERESHYSFQAQHDPLTGVANRHHFELWITSKLADRQQPPCALVLMQIRGLSQLTDIYGVEAANQLLKAATGRVKAALGARDRIARFESDRFSIYVEGTTAETADQLRERLTSAFAPVFPVGDAELSLDVHFGVALYPDHGHAYADLLRRANIALSQTFVKRTHFEIYESGQDALHLRRIQITHSLRDAAMSDQFELFLQPQLNLRNQNIERVEALVRWRHPALGLLLPDEFIPLAEHSGHITELSTWLVDKAIAQLSEWKRNKIRVGISINISAQDLLKSQFVDHLAAAIRGARIEKSRLLVEITETAMMEQPRQAVRNLRRLSRTGLAVAMDDFGTGFSSLSQLKSLPLQELKIDKSFILNLDRDGDDQKIVKAAIEMAHNLGITVVAEGVENEQSLAILDALGCDLIQGNFLSKAMPAHQFGDWLAALEPQPFADQIAAGTPKSSRLN